MQLGRGPPQLHGAGVATRAAGARHPCSWGEAWVATRAAGAKHLWSGSLGARSHIGIPMPRASLAAWRVCPYVNERGGGGEAENLVFA